MEVMSLIGNNLYFKSIKRIILKISILLIKVRKSYLYKIQRFAGCRINEKSTVPIAKAVDKSLP